MSPCKHKSFFSPHQFADEGLLEDVRSILATTGMDPTNLELEITESMLIKEAGRAMELLKTLRALGIKLAVDDSGPDIRRLQI